VLNAEKKATKDPRQAYGAMQEQMADIIRAFRDLPGRHVYMSAKLDKSQDEMGKMLYAPSMPGNKTGQQLPYFFDEVLAARTHDETNSAGETVTTYYYQCKPCSLWSAKDRSGALDKYEDGSGGIGPIIDKIRRGA